MTLNELKYFCALAEKQNFRKASEQCFVSQPTLSVAIKKLEEELDVALFERQKQKVLLTEMGALLLPYAQKAIQQTQLLKQTADNTRQQAPTLKMGAIYTIGPYLFPQLLSQIQQHTPNLHLTIDEDYTDQLAEKLQQGVLDVIVVSLPFEMPNIKTVALYQEPFYAALPKTHPLAQQSQISLEALEKEPLFLLGAGHCFRDQILAAYPQLKTQASHETLQKTLEGSSLETIRYMVASGAGVTILPCGACQNQDELLAYLPLKESNAQRTVVMAWRQSFPQPDLMQVFQKVLQLSNIPCTQPIENA